MELKERIIEATIAEFNDKGLKFTMNDVAKRLEISKRPFIPYLTIRKI